MTRLAEVCRTYTVHSPSLTAAFSTTRATCAVISCRPCLRVATVNGSTIRPGFERGYRRKRLALQELEERAARRGDVIHVAGDAELVDRRDRVPAAGDGKGLRARDGARERLGTF